MNSDYENDPYYIPSVPRYREFLSEPFNDSIGDNFFKIACTIDSPILTQQNLTPKKQIVCTSIPTPKTSHVKKPLQPTENKALQPPPPTGAVARPRRSRSLIKPGRPSLDNKKEPEKPIAPTVVPINNPVPGNNSILSRFARKPSQKPTTVISTSPVGCVARPRRSCSLIKPGRPSLDSKKQKTEPEQKTEALKPPISAKNNEQNTNTASSNSRFSKKFIFFKPIIPTLSTPTQSTPTKRRSSYMAPTFSSTQKDYNTRSRSKAMLEVKLGVE